MSRLPALLGRLLGRGPAAPRSMPLLGVGGYTNEEIGAAFEAIRKEGVDSKLGNSNSSSNSSSGGGGGDVGSVVGGGGIGATSAVASNPSDAGAGAGTDAAPIPVDVFLSAMRARAVAKGVDPAEADPLVKLLTANDDKTDINDKTNNSNSSSKNEGAVTTVPAIHFSQFDRFVRSVGEQLDPRVRPMALCFGLTGTSVGIVLPCMPLLIQQLGISPQQYGLIVASFGVSKLLGNIPVGYLVERVGRKPAIVLGLGLCSAGLGGVGLATVPGFGAAWLIVCRFISGIGVSSFLGGASIYISDISNPLNRTRSFAPLMASFQAGTALGPALGGTLMGIVGIAPTFTTVGGLFAALSYFNHKYLQETKTIQDAAKYANESISQGIKSSVSTAFSSWKELLKEKEVRDQVVLQCIYNIVISGSQMTLLPLFMVAEPLSLSAVDIGSAFAGMSIVSVFASQPTAKVADKMGKIPVILASCGLVSLSMLALPYATSLNELLASLIPLALGSTSISSVTQARMSDLATASNRAQALSLLRTAGDCGIISGALLSIVPSDWFSVPAAIEVNGYIMMTGLALFGSRTWSKWSLRQQKK